MTIREKILLGAGVAALLAGAWQYRPGTAPRAAAPATAAPATAAMDSALRESVQRELTRAHRSPQEQKIIDLAATQNEDDPFLAVPVDLTAAERPAEPVPVRTDLPRYEGYLLAGDRHVAFIDGQDYRPGEILPGGEYRLTAITPATLTLTRLADEITVTVTLDHDSPPPYSRP